ncbi:MAG: hypothetical protein AB8B91_07955 [Rubripirellula sp.]
MNHPNSIVGADRRHFLIASILTLSSSGGPQAVAQGRGGVSLRPTPQKLMRVRIEMDVKGNVDVPKNPLISREAERQFPITSDAVFDYEERYRRPADADDSSVVTMAERFYHVAKVESDLNRNQQKTELRDSVRQTMVRRETLPEVIYGVEDYFQRDELDMLRVPVSSIAVDELLPLEAVQEGDRYDISSEAMTSVLNMTSVEANDVVANITSISAEAAKIEFRGHVVGSIEGVPTTVRTVGKLLFDRKMGTCTWLAIGVHETREIGKAEPGFDVAATIKMVRKPMPKAVGLSATPPRLDITGPIPTDRLYVDLSSSQLGISVLMERNWRTMTDVAGTAMMRMIEDDRSIAQCDFRPLSRLKEGAQWTLEALQEEVKRTLGEQLAELVEADQSLSDSGLRVLRVTAQGAVEGVPIRWIIAHFSDDSGRRVLATFTMESDQIERFAGADTQLANSLRFTEFSDRNTAEVAQNQADQAESPRVAKAISDDDSNQRVQSSSDL